MHHMVSFCVFLVSWGTLGCPGGIFWAIHTETKPYSILIEIEYYDIRLHDDFIKLNLQINKKMIKKSKQRYFDVSFRYSMGSLGVSSGNKTDP